MCVLICIVSASITKLLSPMRVDPYVLELTIGFCSQNSAWLLTELQSLLAEWLNNFYVFVNKLLLHSISHCAWNIRIKAEFLHSYVGSFTDKNFENNFTAFIGKHIKEVLSWALRAGLYMDEVGINSKMASLYVASEHIEANCSLTTVNIPKMEPTPSLPT